MSETLYGSVSVEEEVNVPVYGVPGGLNFAVEADFSITVYATIDDGYIFGSGNIAGQYAGDTSQLFDGQTEAFSDYTSGESLDAEGDTTTGLALIGGVGLDASFDFQSTSSLTGPTISGTFSLADFVDQVPLTGTLTLTNSAPPAVPNVTTLALLAADAYGSGPAGTLGWTPASPVENALGQIVNYSNSDGSQIVIAIEGTDPTNPQDILADLVSFSSGSPTSGLTGYVAAVVTDIQNILATNPNATITLTGHSLGGAVAQMVGQYTGFATTTFNAPGAMTVYQSSAIQSALSPLASNVASSAAPNINYRTQGDIVSLIGNPIGSQQTIIPATTPEETVWDVFTNHSINTAISELYASDTTIQSGVVEPNPDITALANSLFSSGQTVATEVSSTVEDIISTVSNNADFLGNPYSAWIDPTPGAFHVFTITSSSPEITSITFEADPNINAFKVWEMVDGSWSAPVTCTAGQQVNFANPTAEVLYEGLSSSGQPAAASDPNLFYALFSGAGTVTGTITAESSAPCYCAGTRIRTDRGEVAVEALRIGDLLETLGGAARRIKWIGRRAYDGRFIAGQHLKLPVCIRRGAIADRVPSRDLWVSPGHAVHVGGRLIPAWRLLNGVSVIQAERVARVEYFHVELETHDVMFAENCPAESFFDDDCRGQFQNAAEFTRLYGHAAPGRGLRRTERGVALLRVQRRLARRAGLRPGPLRPAGPMRGFLDLAGPELVAGWAQFLASPEAPVRLEIHAAGRRVGCVLANEYRADLRQAGLGTGCHAFSWRVPRGVQGPFEVRNADGAVLDYAEAALRAVRK